MNNETKSLIHYRAHRSQETLDDAKLLLDKGKLFSSVNRIYYSMYYSVNALLLSKSLSSSKHSGILALFNKEFVNKNIIDKESGRFFNEMFEFRQKADYKDLTEFMKEDVEVWFKKAIEFISKIQQLLAIP